MSKKYLFFTTIIFMVIIVFYFLTHFNQEQTKERNQSSISQNNNKAKDNQASQPQFLGEKGDPINLIDSRVSITAKLLDDNLAHYYHTELPNGKIIYFFVVKDKNGVYRAAADACQVCFEARMGFRQEGNSMICNSCGNKYSLEKIATEKGGCNPGPINPNLEFKNNKVIIKQLDLEQVTDFF